MALSSRSIPGAEDAAEQIAKLRSQVEMLMKERVNPALNDFAGRAGSAMGSMKGQTEVISGPVREYPLIAILVAIVVGYLAGRVLR